MKTWYEKQGVLIIEKDKDMPKKKDRPTKCIFKYLVHSQHTRVNKQTSHQTIARQISLKKFKGPHFFHFFSITNWCYHKLNLGNFI
jgi:hypothetical protein